MRVLNPEEIQGIWDGFAEGRLVSRFGFAKEIAHIQHQADLKAFVECGEGPCPHDTPWSERQRCRLWETPVA